MHQSYEIFFYIPLALNMMYILTYYIIKNCCRWEIQWNTLFETVEIFTYSKWYDKRKAREVSLKFLSKLFYLLFYQGCEFLELYSKALCNTFEIISHLTTYFKNTMNTT